MPVPPAPVDEYDEHDGSVFDDEGEEEEDVDDDEDPDEADDGELEEEIEDDEEDESLDSYVFEYEEWKNPALKEKTVTAMFSSPRAIAVGTSTGEIFLLTADGLGVMNLGKDLTKHDTAVKDICVDENCDYVASVSEGGDLSIESTSGKDYYKQSFDRPLTSVTLHPQYRLQEDKQFVCGGFEGKVILSSRGFFFGNRKTVVLDEKDGKIYCVRWFGNCIAWATDSSIVLANAKTKKIFLRHPRGTDANRGELFRCNMFWESESRLIVGWASQVFQFEIRQSHFGIEMSAEMLYYFKMPEPQRLVGLCSFDNTVPGHLVAATTESKDVAQQIEFCLIERTKGEQKFGDAINVPNSRRALVSSFILAQTCDDIGGIEATTYLLVSPGGNNVKARRVNDDDRMKFLLRHNKYEDAYRFVCDKSHHVTVYSKNHIGSQYLEHLYAQKQYQKLAQLLPEVLGSSDPATTVKEWEYWIDKFLKDKQAHMVLPWVPRRGRDGRPSAQGHLSSACYELLLNDCLNHNVDNFKRYIDTFSGLYDPKPICNAANNRLKKLRLDKDNGADVDSNMLGVLGECVGLLFEKQANYTEAFRILKDLRGSVELFSFIHRHKIDVSDQLPFLYAKSKEHTLALLVSAATDPEGDGGTLAPKGIMKKIRGHPAFQWEYFSRLALCLDPEHAPLSAWRLPRLPDLPSADGTLSQPTIDADDRDRHCARLAAVVQDNYVDLVQRYIDFAPDDLGLFLRSFTGPASDIGRLCSEHGMYEEAAYLQARAGGKRDALKMLVRKLKSIPKAIDFIREWSDNDASGNLFEILVSTALEVDAKELEGRQGLKFFKHVTRPTDTWKSIASRYNVDLDALMSYNGAVTPNQTVPTEIKVPINLIEALLTAVADTRNVAGVDPILLIRNLPPNCHIPNLAERLKRIAASKKSHTRLMETIITVLNGDIHEAHVNKIRTSMSAVRPVGHRVPCSGCNEMMTGTQSNVVMYRCGHMMHCHCALQAMCDLGAVRVSADQQRDPAMFERTANEFFRAGGTTLQPSARDSVGRDQGFPFCANCVR
jgi:LysM repeat protein